MDRQYNWVTVSRTISVFGDISRLHLKGRCILMNNHLPGVVFSTPGLDTASKAKAASCSCNGLFSRRPQPTHSGRLCASSSAKLDGHACWSCGLTECEFLVLSRIVRSSSHHGIGRMKRCNLGDVLPATDWTGTGLETNSPHRSSGGEHRSCASKTRLRHSTCDA